MHRVVTIEIVREQKRKVIPYLKERVDFQRFLVQIRDMLRKHECSQIVTDEKEVYDKVHGDYTAYTLAFLVRGEKFVMEFPIIFVVNTRGTKNLRMDISGRLMFYKIKAMLADVEIGYLAFNEAMMQFQVISLPNGRQEMLMDYVRDHGAELTAGTADLFQIPGAR